MVNILRLKTADMNACLLYCSTIKQEPQPFQTDPLNPSFYYLLFFFAGVAPFLSMQVDSCLCSSDGGLYLSMYS